MTSFKEFLASQEQRLLADRDAKKQAKERWIAAVACLFDQVSAWIKDSDPHGLVKLDRQLLGDMDEYGFLRDFDGLTTMHILLGDQAVLLRPAVREGLGPHWKPGEGRWAGRVDMIRESNGHEIYCFIRGHDREEWYLRSTRDYQMKILNWESFDAALVSSFS